MSSKPEEARSEPGRKRIKREVLIMSLIAGGLILAGAVYTAVRGSSAPEVTGPVEVQTEGPASMPGPAAMDRHPPGDAPPAQR